MELTNIISKIEYTFLLCEEGEEYVNKKYISKYRKFCVQIKDGTNKS